MEQKHDRGYKALFSHPQLVRELLTSFVDEPWVDEVDYEHATLVDKSFVTRRMAKLESDMIWKLPLRNRNEIYLYLLIEFQSTVDHYMALRVLRYVVEFYGSLLKGKKKRNVLPAVFPLVLYNGDATWTAPKEFSALVDQRITRAFVPQFRYYTIAENEVPEERLIALRNMVGALFLVETGDVEEVGKKLNAIMGILREEQPEVVKTFIRWLNEHFAEPVPLEIENLSTTIQEVPTMLATSIKKKEQEWFREGRKQGRQEGRQEGTHEAMVQIARNLKVKGIDTSIIIEATGLSREEIESL